MATNRNDPQVKALSADFQLRYEPNFAIANAESIIAQLPGLRGYWPMSSVDENGAARDYSAQGRTLSNTGNSLFLNQGLAPAVSLDGATQYLSRADEAGLDILGTEAYMSTPGLTVGGWFRVANFDGAGADALISKSNATTNNRSFILFINSPTNNRIVWRLSALGTAVISVNHTTDLVAARWYFMAGRYTPSSEMAVFLDKTKVVNTKFIPAAIFNSNAALMIGSADAGGLLFNGFASNVFICASALDDVILNNIYEQTRAMYGV